MPPLRGPAKQMSIHTILSILILFTWMFGLHGQGLSQDRPNVIVLMTDDQGYGDFSCHGNPLLKTPNMDNLHAESVRLTDFHVAPMCTPTRGQLLTGIDAMQNGATGVCQGRSMIRLGIPTVANFFADAGYATGHFGKWHLGDSYPHRPQDKGFQKTLHHPAWGITSLADHFGNSYFDPWLRHASAEIGAGKVVEQQYKGYCTDIFFKESMKWMQAQHKNKQPFFLYLATNTPHVPNWCSKKFSKPYSKTGTYMDVKVPADFYGMIANIDMNLAKLEKFLKQAGLRDNTILVYLNDNGTQSQEAAEIFNAGMRGHKTQMYEGGHRVSCFFRWPNGGLIHGHDIETLTQVQDILPTLMELCEIEYWNESGTGTSLAGLLTGAQTGLPDRKLVIQYSFQETSGSKWNRAIVLWDKWRLVESNELYNLAKDPGQKENVFDQHQDIARAMRAYYELWYEKTKPLYDRKRYIHLGNQLANPIILYSNDWQGGYCDNLPNLVAANTKGYWDVVIETAGEYEIELRRWPEESGLALSAGVKGEDIKAHESFMGDHAGARPITYAHLKIADFDQTIPTAASDTYAAFTVTLQPGTTRLETLFSDENREELCSAIYVKIRKK